MKVTKTATAVQKFFNVTMKANPLLLYATAIGAVVAALIYAYTESEKFRNLIDRIGAFIRDELVPIFTTIFEPVVRFVIEEVVKFFELLWETISNVVNLVKAIFQGDFSEAFSIFKDLAINALELLTIAILGFLECFCSKLFRS